jgi:hypothetical protein
MNANSEPKTKILNKKLLAIAVIIIVVVAVVGSWAIYQQSPNSTKTEVTLPTLSLTIVGASGQQVVLDSSKFAAYMSLTANGGYKSENNMTYAGNFTGVPVLALLKLVGGIESSDKVTFVGSDGYQYTFTYQQMQGQNINTFNPTTGAAAQPSQPLTVMVAYYCNSTILASDKGTLSVALVGSQGLYTNGYWWVYHLVKIEVVPP